MSSLPPGVTDDMCEGPRELECVNCGHTEGAHYDEPKIEDEVIHACDVLLTLLKQCECEKFIEGEYEPENDRE